MQFRVLISFSALAHTSQDAQSPPPLPANIPPLTAIAGPKHTPGRELPYNVVDLLYAYAYTLRAFNNDVDDPEDCFDAGRCCAQLSAVLSKNAVHASTALAAHSCLHNAQMVCRLSFIKNMPRRLYTYTQFIPFLWISSFEPILNKYARPLARFCVHSASAQGSSRYGTQCLHSQTWRP